MLSRLANGLVIVVIGALLLMNTTGNLPWTVWEAAFQYWPIILIGLGIQLIFSKWQVPGVAIALIIMMILGAVQPYTLTPWTRRIIPRLPTSHHHVTTKDWRLPLESDVSRLELRLEAPSMDVELRGDSELNAIGDTLALVANLAWDRYEPSVTTQESMGGKALRAVLKSPASNGSNVGKQEWKISANPSLPISVTVSGGVTTIKGDCRLLPLKDLTVLGGVSEVDLSLGLTGRQSRIAVSGGVANVDLTVPSNVGLKVILSGAPFVKQDFSQEGLTKSGNVWVTPGYESANSTVDLIVTCAAGKVMLHRVDLLAD